MQTKSVEVTKPLYLKFCSMDGNLELLLVSGLQWLLWEGAMDGWMRRELLSLSMT